MRCSNTLLRGTRVDLGSYVKFLSRRFFLIGAAIAAIGLYLGFTEGFDGMAKWMSIAGGGLSLLTGIAMLFMRDPE